MKLITLTTFMISLLCGSINSLDAQAKDKAPVQKAKQPKKPNIRDFRKKAIPFGENRYFVGVIQRDGNMDWSSPFWVTKKTP